MRLLVVSQYFWPEAFRVNEFVSSLIARGHAVTVLTGVPNYPDGRVFDAYRRDPGRHASYAGAPVIRVPMLPRGRGGLRLALNYLSFALSASLLGPWKLRGSAFDAIFVFQTSPITVALPAILLRRIKGAPVLMWVLDLWPETLSAVGAVRSRALLAGVGRLVSFIYAHCDRILLQSRAFADNLVRHGAEPSRLRYFPAWCESESGPGANDVAPELAPFRQTFNVVFAGNIGQAQDFPSILDAAEALKQETDVRFLIIGDGRAAESVRADIARRGLGQRVLLLGRFPPERMASFFAGADALLVTLKAEPIFALTIPGKIQSYMASGVPIIAMLDGEGARVVAEAGAGLACPAGRGAQLASRILEFRAMPEAERAAMGARGRAYAAREFDRERLMSAFEGWVDEIRAGGRVR